MKITVRGWSRDMGEKVIIDQELSDVQIRRDEKRYIYRNKPGIFPSIGRVFIAWYQQLRFTGDYRMEIELSRTDLLRLFKAKFGSELDDWLLDEGFTISPDLTKRVLRGVKLTDVTLGDLVAMNAASPGAPATAEKLVRNKITPFRRRV